MSKFKIGDRVRAFNFHPKDTVFIVRSVGFATREHPSDVRYVVEESRPHGQLHFFPANMLEPAGPKVGEVWINPLTDSRAKIVAVDDEGGVYYRGSDSVRSWPNAAKLSDFLVNHTPEES